jgi:hypothetical protein
MGYTKFKRPLLAPSMRSFSTRAPFVDGRKRTTVAISSTATVMPLNGTVALNATATGDKSFKLATAALGGKVHVTAVDSTHVHTVTTRTSAATFFGTTFQGLTWSTSLAYRAATFEVVGPSTNLQWHVVSKSTGATLA